VHTLRKTAQKFHTVIAELGCSAGLNCSNGSVKVTPMEKINPHLLINVNRQPEDLRMKTAGFKHSITRTYRSVCPKNEGQKSRVLAASPTELPAAGGGTQAT